MPPFDMPDPTMIMQLATGYWPSAALLAANELGIFKALAEGHQTADAVASNLSADPRAVSMLLITLADLGLLTCSEGIYSLTPAAAAYLVPGSPAYLGSAIRWSADQYSAWGSLAQSVREGAPAVDPAMHLGDDESQTRAFVEGMYQRAQGIARGVVHFLPVKGAKRLLDVGGGPGAYASLMAGLHLDMKVEVLDLPGIVKVAEELHHERGGTGSVTFRAGDATSGEYGDTAYDAVLFSGVLHQFSPETIQRMFAGAVNCLNPGGRIVVSDVMRSGSETRSPFAALFSLQMLLTTNEGAVFEAADCANWLEQAGLTDIVVQALPPPMPYTIISAVRP